MEEQDRAVRVFRSFEEQEAWTVQYYHNLSPEERLDLIQHLRELYYEFKNESRKGFQRVYRIVKQE